MNRSLILLLSLFGVVMGLLSLGGVTQGIEWFLWLVIAVLSAVPIAKRGGTSLFGTGFLVGLLDGIFNSIIQALFFEAYLANNQQMSVQMSQIPGDLDPRIFVMLAGPVIGAAYGTIIGLISMLARRIMRNSAHR
jgi:hypothetical protein